MATRGWPKGKLRPEETRERMRQTQFLRAALVDAGTDVLRAAAERPAAVRSVARRHLAAIEEEFGDVFMRLTPPSDDDE